MELTPRQIAALNRLHSRGFEIVAFPMYASYVGARKGNCAMLLAPLDGGSFSVFGAPAYLIDGNLGVRIAGKDGNWFVWKKFRVEATPERIAELEAFARALAEALLPAV
jgi:hypothetical protein